MCGITGVLRFGEPTTPSYNMSAIYLATSLLESSEVRGKDATGIAALFDDGKFFVQKMAVTATEFCSRAGGNADDYEGLLAILRGYSKASLRCVLGHCRKKSAGALNNVDNHPIKAGNILGVHNGTLKNDDKIFENLGCQRDGEVDSEAIFRLLQFFTHDCADPFTLDAVEETCKRLEGTFSFLAINANNPYQVVSARDGRPAEYCLIKPLGIVLIASEKKFIDHALYKYNRSARLFPTGNDQTALIPLKQADIEHVSMNSDTISIFDLTKTIGEETKITDLYITRKIPFVINRIWKSEVTTTYGNNSIYNSAGHHVDKKTTDTTNTATTTTTDTSKNTSTGRIWTNTFNKLVTNFEKKITLQFGAIINTETKTMSDLVKGHLAISQDAAEILKLRGCESNSEVKKTVDCMERGLTIFANDHNVEDFSYGETVRIIDASPDIPVNIAVIDKTVADVKAIIMMKEGIEKGKLSVAGELGANEAVVSAAKDLEKFESNAEVADFMNIDEASLDELPTKATANRLIKKLFAKFFVQGWMACHKNGSICTVNNATDEKLERAKKHVRILKTLQISLIQKLVTDDEATLRIISETTKELAKTSELSSESLRAIFSIGDIRKYSILRRVASSL